MTNYDKLYIGGAWVEPAPGAGTLDVIDSTTEEVFATIPDGTPADIDRAVAAAKGAFEAWADEPGAERGKLLAASPRSSRPGATRSPTSSPTRSACPSRSRPPSRSAPASPRSRSRRSWSPRSSSRTTPTGSSSASRSASSAAITPWNYPLNQIGAKVAYALAAGCTVVLKPSEVAPVNAFILAEIIDEIGFPAGVFNLVTGIGSVVGEALAAHPDVDMISFTGSTRAGKRVAELASQSVKSIALELGGKSPNVILDDADFPTAVKAGVGAAYANSGQTCSALTRMIVPRSRLAEVEQIARETAESYTVGDPFAEGTRLGPLISEIQLGRVRGYIQKGIDEGATLVTGGPDAPEGLDTGYFVQPTVFSNVTRDMTIAQEEIFGPVLSIMPYDTEEEAIEIANDTVYGLAGGVSGSDERARRVARRIRAGQVRVNNGRGGTGAPFGGYKQSGLGREHGEHGLEEFLEVKALFV